MDNKPTGHCKLCLEEVIQVYSGKLSKGGNYLYVDDKGRLWKGSVCPTCQAERRKEQRRAKSSHKRVE